MLCFRSVLPLFAMAAGVANAQQESLLWSQEFDDSVLDELVWNYDLGKTGWGNQELQEYTKDNVFLENGALVIRADKNVNNLMLRGDQQSSSMDIQSGRINTLKKFSFLYGTVETMVQFPNLADGLWPAVWFLGDSFPETGWPACGELDLVEMGSASAIGENKVNQRVGSTAHWNDNNDGYATYGLHYDRPSLYNDGLFHNFTMTWTPYDVSTYVDGQWIWSFDISNPDAFGGHEFHQPFAVLVNMAVGGSYTGRWSAEEITAAFPAELKLDYIRVYKNAFTVQQEAPPSSCLQVDRNCITREDCCSNVCKRGWWGQKTCRSQAD